MRQIGTYQIHDTFKITGRGIVFVGKILEGDIFLTGDFIEFEFNGQPIRRKITGIDNGMRVQEGKPNVGVLIQTQDDQEISDLRNWNPDLTVGKIYSPR